MKTQTSTEHKPVQHSEREFLKYTFFKVDSQWRRLGDQEKTTTKEQFASIVRNFTTERIRTSYSLIGIRGDSDFMFWAISKGLEGFQEFTSNLQSSALGKYLETPYSYHAITRQSKYLDSHDQLS